LLCSANNSRKLGFVVSVAVFYGQHSVKSNTWQCQAVLFAGAHRCAGGVRLVAVDLLPLMAARTACVTPFGVGYAKWTNNGFFSPWGWCCEDCNDY
jgi:hypothetical protein